MAGASVPLISKGGAVGARFGLGSGSGTSALCSTFGWTGVASERPGVSGGVTIASIGPLGLRSGSGTLVVAVAASLFGLTKITPVAVTLEERLGSATFVVEVPASCCGVTVGEAEA